MRFMTFSIAVVRGSNKQPRSRLTLSIRAGSQINEVSPADGIQAAAHFQDFGTSLAAQRRARLHQLEDCRKTAGRLCHSSPALSAAPLSHDPQDGGAHRVDKSHQAHGWRRTGSGGYGTSLRGIIRIFEVERCR
jgi:hypothetical protein